MGSNIENNSSITQAAQRANRHIERLNSRLEAHTNALYHVQPNPTTDHVTRLIHDLQLLVETAMDETDDPMSLQQQVSDTVTALEDLREEIQDAPVPDAPFEGRR